MTPTLRLNRQFSELSKRTDYSDQSFFKKLSSFVMADKVLYRKLKPSDLKQLIGKVVAVQNPFNVKEVVYRRITATEHFWVRRMDNAGIIEIPKHHVWIECESKEEGQRNLDSITNFGPISQQFVLGEVQAIVWPPQRIQIF